MPLKEVCSFTDYHGSVEQEHAKIAKSFADFTIRHYGSATTVVFEGCEEESPNKDDTHQRRGHKFIQLRQIHQVRRRVPVKRRIQTETEPNE